MPNNRNGVIPLILAISSIDVPIIFSLLLAVKGNVPNSIIKVMIYVPKIKAIFNFVWLYLIILYINRIIAITNSMIGTIQRRKMAIIFKINFQLL